MNNEEIIITTESIKVSELEGREKQIYDYAYNRGHDDALQRNNAALSKIIFGVGLILFAIVFFYKLGR